MQVVSVAVSLLAHNLIVHDMQALAAASKTVDHLKVVHSLHAYFLLIGDLDRKYIFYVLKWCE